MLSGVALFTSVWSVGACGEASRPLHAFSPEAGRITSEQGSWLYVSHGMQQKATKHAPAHELHTLTDTAHNPRPYTHTHT